MMKLIPLATAALAPLGAALAADAPANRAPNVILIIGDDLGYGDISCNGQGKIKTPNIDRMAAEGLRLTDGYAPASTCTPTRYGLITGEHPWRKRGTGILPGDAALIISPSRNTLPRIFQKAGYVTGAIGKWHMGLGTGKIDFNRHITPGINEVGFDYSFNMAATGDRVPCVYMENGRVVNLDPADPIKVSYGKKVGDWPTGKEHPELLRMKSNEGHADTIINGIGRIGFMTGGKAALWNDRTLSDTFNGKACDFIRNNKAKPFFLYYAAHEPHVPRDPNPRFVGKSGLGARADAVLQFDDEVARIFETLKKEGLDDNTLVILSSDNGPALADGYADGALKAETEGGHRANGVYRGGKYTEYEGGLRMPFIARWPGRIRAGGVCAEPVCLTDMAATAAALTGQTLAPTDAPDSRDILPVLTAGAKSPHDFMLFGNPDRERKASAIREGRWKLITTRQGHLGRNPQPDTPAPKGAPLLFDLEKDPTEATNLADQHPDVVKRLAAKLEAASAAGFTRPGAAPVDIR